MKVRQVPPIPSSLVRVKGHAIATYDPIAFLDTHAQDLGGRAATQITRGSVCARGDQRIGIALAGAVILVALILIVLVSLKLQYL